MSTVSTAPDWRTQYVAARAALDATLSGMSVTLSARFVPQSLSRNRKAKDRSLNWLLTVAREGRGKGYEFEYTQGIGHVPGRPQWRRPTSFQVDAETRASEEGVYPKSWNMNRLFTSWQKIPPPPLAEVVGSLLLDADCGEESFQDWCDNLGYDSDSRKAEAMYRACQEVSSQLRQMFSTEESDTLRGLVDAAGL